MDVLITYDVRTSEAEGKRRLRHVAKTLTNYGQRVQKSVFECRLDRAQLEELEEELVEKIDEEEDSLRIYRLPPDRERAVTVYGSDEYQDFDDPLIR